LFCSCAVSDGKPVPTFPETALLRYNHHVRRSQR
jgi:hypothetical protein